MKIFFKNSDEIYSNLINLTKSRRINNCKAGKKKLKLKTKKRNYKLGDFHYYQLKYIYIYI